MFRQECVFCHGFAAKGGMRGPDLTTGSWSHGGSDAELAGTISAGVPGTAMPPNNLTTDEIWQIVTYLRTLQQPVTASVGDPTRGDRQVPTHSVGAEAEVAHRLELAELDGLAGECLRDDRPRDVARVLARPVVVEHSRDDAR